MNDEEKIRECYRKMYEGMIRKDTDLLKESLDETYELVHMTGVRISRQEYIDAILD